ncbi:MAG: hypothetical protein K6G27_08975 [Lachnospiraceae bacterium]|nr:hypothetical protein [Lachnospiraceae bacterium]
MNNSELCEIAKKHEDCGKIEKAYQCYLEAALAEDDGEATTVGTASLKSSFLIGSVPRNSLLSVIWKLPPFLVHAERQEHFHSYGQQTIEKVLYPRRKSRTLQRIKTQPALLPF